MQLSPLVVLFTFIQRLPTLLLYAGPDQLIPIASFIGAIVGFILIFWQRCVSLIRRAFQSLTQKLRPSGGK